MRRRNPARPCALVAILAGCSEPFVPPDPPPASMTMVIRTSGLDRDPDGYLLSLDGGPTIHVGRDTTIDFENLGKGSHQAVLSGVASWCEVPDGTERHFEYTDEGAQQIVVDVECRATFRDWLLYSRSGRIELHDLTGDPGQRGRLGYTSIECNAYCIAPAISPTGERVAWITSSSIELMNADGSGRRTLRETTGATLGTLAWSPDGERLAYVGHSDGVGVREDIFIIEVDGSEDPFQVTSVGDAEGLSWSPDGSTLVFSRWEFEIRLARLWLVRVDGQNLRLLGAEGIQQRSPAWSPDGRSIAYETGTIRIINADGTNDRVVGPDVGLHPAWSPDGQRIAFVQYDLPSECVSSIMTMNADGSDVQPAGPSSDTCAGDELIPVRHPAWGPDGI